MTEFIETDFGADIGNKVLRCLRELGETSTEVFENLLALNCYGKKMDGEGCPVWSVLDKMALDKYVEEVLGDCAYINFVVDAGGITVDWETHHGVESAVITPVPLPVYEFIINFDDGIYPQLDTEPPTIAPSA